MSRLPRYQPDAKVSGQDLNLILAILDTGGIINIASATNSGVTGDGLSPTTPNVAGSISPNPGAVGAPVTPRGFSGVYGIDNFSQSHTAYVVLSWTPNPVADFVQTYDLYYHKGSDPTLYNVSVSGDVNSVRINNLFPGNTYSFAIQAHDAANRTSQWSPELNIVISGDVDPPAIPTGFTATGTTRGVYLKWTEVGPEGISNDLKQYQIAISTDSGATYPTIQTVGPGNTHFYPYVSNNPASAPVTIFFKIASIDWTGNISAYSAPISVAVGGLAWNELTSRVSYFNRPSNPTGTTSTGTAVMMGLAGAITPQVAKILVAVSGTMSNSVSGDGTYVEIRYGTGTAPTNGAASTGTLLTACRFIAAAAGQQVPFSLTGIISGLTPNTAYWLDAAVQALTGGTAAILDIAITAMDN